MCGAQIFSFKKCKSVGFESGLVKILEAWYKFFSNAKFVLKSKVKNIDYINR